MKFTIRSFDKSRGQGYGTLEDGQLAVIYACNIKGKKTWYPETACVFYNVGQVVDVEIQHERFVCGITPGHLDQAKWNSLDQDRLAFKCNDEGTATCGLFAKAGAK